MKIAMRFVLVVLCLVVVIGGDVSAQGEVLRDGQSGLTVSASQASAKWKNTGTTISNFAITATVSDVLDLGFSYTEPIYRRRAPVRVLSAAFHLGSDSPEGRVRLVTFYQTRIGVENFSAYVLGAGLYKTSNLTNKISLIPAITGGLARSGSSGTSYGGGAKSEFVGGLSLGFSYPVAQRLRLTVIPFFNFGFLPESVDLLGVSVALTAHSKGSKKVGRKAEWGDYSYVQ